MNSRTTFQTIESIVKTRAGLVSDLDPDARFREDLDIDSLLVIDIVIDIEKEFGVSIPESEMVNVSTPGTAAELVDRLLANRRAA